MFVIAWVSPMFDTIFYLAMQKCLIKRWPPWFIMPLVGYAKSLQCLDYICFRILLKIPRTRKFTLCILFIETERIIVKCNFFFKYCPFTSIGSESPSKHFNLNVFYPLNLDTSNRLIHNESNFLWVPNFSLALSYKRTLSLA